MNTRATVEAGFAGVWDSLEESVPPRGTVEAWARRMADAMAGLVPLKPYISPAEQRRRDAADDARLTHIEERDAALVRAIGRAFG